MVEMPFIFNFLQIARRSMDSSSTTINVGFFLLIPLNISYQLSNITSPFLAGIPVRGRENQNVVPCLRGGRPFPSLLSNHIFPFDDSTTALTRYSPSPDPSVSSLIIFSPRKNLEKPLSLSL